MRVQRVHRDGLDQLTPSELAKHKQEERVTRRMIAIAKPIVIAFNRKYPPPWEASIAVKEGQSYYSDYADAVRLSLLVELKMPCYPDMHPSGETLELDPLLPDSAVRQQVLKALEKARADLIRNQAFRIQWRRDKRFERHPLDSKDELEADMWLLHHNCPYRVVSVSATKAKIMLQQHSGEDLTPLADPFRLTNDGWGYGGPWFRVTREMLVSQLNMWAIHKAWADEISRKASGK